MNSRRQGFPVIHHLKITMNSNCTQLEFLSGKNLVTRWLIKSTLRLNDVGRRRVFSINSSLPLWAFFTDRCACSCKTELCKPSQDKYFHKFYWHRAKVVFQCVNKLPLFCLDLLSDQFMGLSCRELGLYVSDPDHGCCVKCLEAFKVCKWQLYCTAAFLVNRTDCWNDFVSDMSIRATVAHFSPYTRLYFSYSLINNPAALRLEARRRPGATYHVELKAVVFLHQTQHKHAETCNRTNTVWNT